MEKGQHHHGRPECQMSARLLYQQKLKGKVNIWYRLLFSHQLIKIYFSFPTMFSQFTSHYIFSLLYPNANRKPDDDLTKLVALDIEDIIAKTGDISKDILFNVHLLKEWGADSLGVLLEDMMQELLTGVTTQNYLALIIHSCYLFLPKTFSVDLTYDLHFIWTHSHPSPSLKWHSLFIPGSNLLELTTYLEQNAGYLKWEWLGCIKIAMAGTATSSFLEILQAPFGQAGLINSSDEEDVPIKEEEGTFEETKAEKTKEIGNLATVELVFPFKSIPLVVAAIPKDLLPLHGCEAQSQYHYQAPQCGLDFAQKDTACNQVQHDHLNVALACFYCSFEDNP